MSRELNFKLMFGLKLNEEMPEQLRTSLGDYLEEAVKKHVEPGLDNIVKQYAEENGMSKERSIVTRSRGAERISSEDMPEDSSKIGEYFSRLAKRKGKTSNSSISEETDSKLKEITKEIEEISKDFKREDPPEIGALRAYKVLDLRIKAEIIKMESALTDGDSLPKIIKEIKESALSKSSDMSNRKKVLLEEVTKEVERSPLILNKAMEDLRKLQVMDEDEYKKLDLKDQKEYLIEIKNQFNKIVDFAENEIKMIQSKLLQNVTKNLDFGDHLSIALS